MTAKRFTTVELPKPNRWGIWYDGACLSTYQVCILLNEYVDVKKENEQLNKSRDELISENRHIKKTIQTMLINERTAIGKSVLKQLWNAIHME